MSGLHLKVLETESVKVVKDEYNFVDMDEDLKGNNYFLVSIEEYAKENKKIEDNYKKSKDAATQEYNRTYNSNKEKALEIWDINLKRITKRREKEIKKLSDKYNEVQWIWQLSPKNPLGDNMTANRTISKGFSADWRRFHFPTFLVGGGFVYLEAFFPNDEPKKRTPYGIFVRCLGKAAIIRTEWTDLRDNPINGAVKPGSIVRLHIYTLGLYGQDIDVVLSHNEFIYKPCEVNVYNVNHNEDGKPGVSGFLNSGDKSETYLQKATLDICILKEEFGNNTDLTVDKVYSNNRKNEVLKIKGFENKILEIRENGHLYERPQGVNPVVKNEVFTNIAMFHPCGYDRIEVLVDDKKITLFDINTPEQKSSLEIVNDSENELQQLNIKTIGLKTDDCRFENTEKDHSENLVEDLSLTNECIIYKINKEAAADLIVEYPPIDPIEAIFSDSNTHIDCRYNVIGMKGLEYFEPKKYSLLFNSCRINHQLDISIYPDIQYTFEVHLGTEDNIYIKESKKYQERHYRGEQDPKTKVLREEFYKKNEVRRLEGVNSQITKDNFRDEYKLLIAKECKVGKKEPIVVNFNTPEKLENIIQTFLYIYNIIDSYLFGKKMRMAEEGEIDYEYDRNISEDRKRTNKTKYNELKKKRDYIKSKYTKITDKLPLRITVSPPKFVAGISWKYTQSKKISNAVGVNYNFKLGALPLFSVEGRLDLIFGAQFIPYLGQIVKTIDDAIQVINGIGDIMETFKIGSIQADYYFDLVTAGELNIDMMKGVEFHTIDGLTTGNIDISLPCSIGLEAGGSIKAKFLDIKGEASINGEATAKFILYIIADNKGFLQFDFQGIEAIIKSKVVLEAGFKNNKNNKNNIKEKNISILDGFSMKIPIFDLKKEYLKKDEE